jgi:hydroxyacyl-ACP dehydratase HTD2-like protein with hotdog domain
MALIIDDIRVGDELPSRAFEATNVSLFLYNAAVWNAHRIHYDAFYTKEVEGYPDIVIDGPLQGDWLSQVATSWMGDAGRVVRFGYSNRSAAYLGEVLTTSGRVTAIDAEARRVELELFVTNEAGEVTTPGTATVELFA